LYSVKKTEELMMSGVEGKGPIDPHAVHATEPVSKARVTKQDQRVADLAQQKLPKETVGEQKTGGFIGWLKRPFTVQSKPQPSSPSATTEVQRLLRALEASRGETVGAKDDQWIDVGTEDATPPSSMGNIQDSEDK
jgi:hypothetical protein